MLSQALLIRDHISSYSVYSVILTETHPIDLVKAESKLGKNEKGFSKEKGKKKKRRQNRYSSNTHKQV